MSGTTQNLEINSTWGTIMVDLLDGKVTSCHLPRLDTAPVTPFKLLQQSRDSITSFIRSVLLGRNTPTPALTELKGTHFQQTVWKAIAAIPPGQTRTYGKLAETIGRPAAFRAAANACGRNPVPLFIPCHRVVGSRGGLGGFSSGLAWKALLLSAEGSFSYLPSNGLASIHRPGKL